MYKRSSQGWMKHLDFILLDTLSLQLAYILGFWIRHHKWWPYAVNRYDTLGILLIVVNILVAILFNTMHNVVKRGFWQEFVQTVKQVAIVFAFMSLYLFSTQSGDVYSRITLYLTAGFHVVFGYLFRVLWKLLIRRIGKGKGKATMILVAEEKDVRDILARASSLDNFQYSGIVLSDRDGSGESIDNIPVVASLSTAADYICREHVDEVFIYPAHLADLKSTPGAAEEAGVAMLMAQCREMAIPVHVSLPVISDQGKSFIEKVGGYDVITTTANYAKPWQLALKRLFDILGGLVGSLIALILIAIIGPRIKKESPGPILFRQTRIGLNGKKFTCYKIRSMYMDAEERKKELMAQNRVSDGMMFKMDWDPRIIGNRIENGKQVTGIGEMIRRTSLDEFPQFFNILRGDMSIVGTRPPTEDEWEKYKYHHRARLATKPGLTGMWQVSGRSTITDFEEVVKLDTEYINNWSIGLDLRILLKTFKTVLKKDGAM